MEPLTRQAVAVQRKHTVEKGVPLLDPQQAPLAINQRQFIVQTRMRRRRRRNESNKSHEQSADRQHTAAGQPDTLLNSFILFLSVPSWRT
ncbi:Uncharacterised protein [Mycobacteroides abscessus subsp. massiliense]|nr:Uncharacterised protein [Mycobacteroides abscessus subsp. massiliense]